MAGRVLITGANGFTGRHLVARLHAAGDWTVIATGRADRSDLPVDDYIPADLTDAAASASLVAQARPEAVIHAASVVWHPDGRALEEINLRMFENLCAGLRRATRSTPVRVVTVGSAAELGRRGTSRLPITEEAECLPETAYGRSKLAVTRRALGEPADGPLRVAVARTFNLVGPGMDARLSLGAFARQILAYRDGETDRIRCGPLDPVRDFLDVRDAADAFISLLAQGEPGQIYNVCSGVPRRMGDLLARLAELAGLDAPRVESTTARKSSDPAAVYGDPTKLREATGWSPRISLDESLTDLLASLMTEKPVPGPRTALSGTSR